MNVFVDTSVLVSAVLENHGFHAPAFAVLDRVQNGADDGFISAHTLAEMYATLTRLPAPFRHSPQQAFLSIDSNVVEYFKIVSLTEHDYVNVLRHSSLAGIEGGTVYDAILLKSASKCGAERVYTLNLKHFKAVAPPELAPLIFPP